MTSPEMPLVSIVTPSYNMAKYLPEAIESVLNQNYPHLEYIVVDGGSKDETLALLAQYEGRLRYSSGPDRGPSDAIAQGLRQSKGDILGWLNADDSLLPGAVQTAVEYFQKYADVDVVYGEAWWVGEDGSKIGRYPSRVFDPELLKRDCFICQPAAFVRAEAYRRCELDPSVNLSFDYDLWIRMAKAGMRFAFIPAFLANSRIHQGALSISERGAVFQSSMTLLQRHYGYVPLSWIFGYTAFLLDRRDQFLKPMRPSLLKYLASLPVGLWLNRRHPVRFLSEWIGAPLRVARRSLERTDGR